MRRATVVETRPVVGKGRRPVRVVGFEILVGVGVARPRQYVGALLLDLRQTAATRRFVGCLAEPAAEQTGDRPPYKRASVRLDVTLVRRSLVLAGAKQNGRRASTRQSLVSSPAAPYAGLRLSVVAGLKPPAETAARLITT